MMQCTITIMMHTFKKLFLYLGSEQPQHAIILQNKDVIEECCLTSTDYFVDATFRVCPKHQNIFNVRSAQVLNIFAERDGHAILMFAVIMTTKKLALYEKVLEVIKQHYPILKPKTMMSDYEAAMRKAFKKKFPGSRMLGCR